jgi:hypothetical protein
VFNTVILIGKTSDDVIAVLDVPTASNESGDDLQFTATPGDSLVYRFDNGTYGWQFSVMLDATGKVREVERRWIK